MVDNQIESVEATVYFAVKFQELANIASKEVDADAVKILMEDILNRKATAARGPNLGLQTQRLVSIVIKPAQGKQITPHGVLALKEGSLAMDIVISSADVWRHLGILGDEIYSPDGELSKSKLPPSRIYVKEARLTFDSVADIYKEEAHLKLATIAAKKIFFDLAKEEMLTHEALADMLAQAEKSKFQLDKMTAMFDQISVKLTDSAQLKRGVDLLRDSHQAVQSSAGLVSQSSETAFLLHKMSEEAKLASYFCAARAGTKESYQDWAQREFLFVYLPKSLLTDSSKSLVMSPLMSLLVSRYQFK
jgi:hypothetical protein